MFALAHLSDLHLAATTRPKRRELLNKRLFGYLNWYRGRRKMHLRTALDALTSDLLAQKPDHIALTGDLVNFGLPGEFEEALGWLKTFGTPECVTVVPGNHDAYISIPFDTGIGRWRDYMRSDHQGLEYKPDNTGFPFVRLRGEIALVGLCSAVPTLPFMASGRIGAAQINALGIILDALGKDDLFRVVLVHHPPLPGLAPWRRGLHDASQLAACLRKHGAELVLYGHDHRQKVDYLDPAARQGVVACVPSASIGGGGVLARYNLYCIERKSTSAWRIEMIGRGLPAVGAKVDEIERLTLTE